MWMTVGVTCILWLLFTYFWEQALSLNLELIDSSRLDSQQAPRPSCLCLPGAGVTGTHHCTWLFFFFYVDSVDPNSGPPMCAQEHFVTQAISQALRIKSLGHHLQFYNFYSIEDYPKEDFLIWGKIFKSIMWPSPALSDTKPWIQLLISPYMSPTPQSLPRLTSAVPLTDLTMMTVMLPHLFFTSASRAPVQPFAHFSMVLD